VPPPRLMWRALRPALAKPDESCSLLVLCAIVSIAIPSFYAFVLSIGSAPISSRLNAGAGGSFTCRSKGFFEVFANVAIAFLITRVTHIIQVNGMTDWI
jgi:nitric oxide reductase subunit B